MSFEDKTIKLGVVSEYARLVQRVFRETVDATVVVDGIVGNGTMSAVDALARLIGADPKAGYSSEVCKMVDCYIETRFVSEDDYRKIAKSLDCPYNHLRAVCEVESNGSAFLPDGRAVILFERHKFRQQLLVAAKNADAFKAISRDAGVTATSVEDLVAKVSAKYPNICNSVRGGYLGGAKEYDRLGDAAEIHIETGYWSASYGAFQIMGFNHKLAGYNSATEMMLDFNRSEAAQLNGLVRFIKAQPAMLKALREGKWADFARLYNGASFAENKYDIKLDASAKRWAKYN